MNAFDANDPKLTAFALGELHGDDAAAMEAALTQDEALRIEVDEIRRSAELLKAGFAAESPLGLTQSQREAIQERPVPQVISRPWIFQARTWWTAAGLAAAACLAYAIYLPMWTPVKPPDQVATLRGNLESRERHNGTDDQKLGLEFKKDAAVEGRPQFRSIASDDAEKDRNASGGKLEADRVANQTKAEVNSFGAPEQAGALQNQPAGGSPAGAGGPGGGFAGGGGGGGVDSRAAGSGKREAASPGADDDEITARKQYATSTANKEIAAAPADRSDAQRAPRHSQTDLAPQAAAKPAAPELAKAQVPPPGAVAPPTAAPAPATEEFAKDAAAKFVIAVPPLVDLGDICSGESARGTFRLMNTGVQAVEIREPRTSSASIIVDHTNLPAILSSGVALNIQIEMKGDPVRGEMLNESVVVAIPGQPDLVVPVKARVVQSIVAQPKVLDPQSMPDGKFTLKSTDGRPFRIMSMQPPVIEEFPKDARAEFDLTLSWNWYRNIGITPQLAFLIDHPVCHNVFVPTNFKPEELVAADVRRKEIDNELGGAPPAANWDPADMPSQAVHEIDRRLSHPPAAVAESARPAARRSGRGFAGGGPGGAAPPPVAPKYAEKSDERIHAQLRKRIDQGPNTEQFQPIFDNEYIKPEGVDALSTFSIDVDTASYSNIRRMLFDEKRLPPKDAVRVEEMVNYFNYRYEPPTAEDKQPFSAAVEINAAPWNAEHRLVRIGLKGREINQEMRPATSLVFLIDVSGSMQPANKLPLVRDATKLLVAKLNADDRLAIVTYAGNAAQVLDSTYVNQQNKPTILNAIDQLNAGGSTNGGGGIVMAYDIATKYYITGGVNRVVLCTDGDFNVGVTSDGDLVRLIEDKRKSNVFLSVLGFGTGNYQDAKMQQLADAGNGNHSYIDTIEEGKKVLVDQMCGTLITIAKDVKIQVEFNPAKVGMYRLIGYENRMLEAQDFNNDKKDAGEIGAGHTVTALYEIVPPGVSARVAGSAGVPAIDELEFQKPATQPQAGVVVQPSDDLLILKLRYKDPEGDESKLIKFPVKDGGAGIDKASPDFQFAAAVAGFGMILRESPYKGNATFATVLDLASAGAGEDTTGYRTEFIKLVEQARSIADAVTAGPR